MKLQIVKGSTSQILTVFIQDSSSTTGAGLGGLDQTSSIVGGHVRAGATGVALAVDENVATEGTYAAPSTAAQVRIGTPANMRTGTYELHFHNDLFAAAADSVFVTLGGASDMADLLLEIQLTDVDLNDGVRGGMAALPNAPPDSAGGIPVSDAGGLDLDVLLGVLTSLAAETRSANLLDQLKTIIAVIESQLGGHTHQPSTGAILFVDQTNGDTHANGNRGGISDPYDSYDDAETNAGTDFGHDLYIMVAGAAAAATTHSEDFTVANGYSLIRGPGRGLMLKPTANSTVAVTVTADGCELSGFQVDDFDGTGSQVGIQITDADFATIHHVWFNETRGDGINILRGSNCFVACCVFNGTGVSGSGQGVHITGTGPGVASDNVIHNCHFANTGGDSILIDQGTTNDTEIHHNTIHDSVAWGINIGASSNDAQVHSNILGNNASGNINDGGTTSIIKNNREWLSGTDATTQDGETNTVGVAATGFIEGVEGLTLVRTTIATLASQTSFTLTAGSTDDTAYHGLEIVIEDATTAAQKASGLISAYTGGSKTITLAVDPGVFTMAVGDKVTILASATAFGVADEILTGARHNVTNSLGRKIRELDEQIGYQDGAIWFDSVNGTGGQVVGENGRVNTPSNSEADTLALAVANKSVRIHVASGSTFTAPSAVANLELFNFNWTLVLNAKSFSGSCIQGANVSGIATGANPAKFMACHIAATTLPPCILMTCGIGVGDGQFTAGSAGNYEWIRCWSEVAGPGTPDADFSGLGSAVTISNRDFFGGLNYTLDSDCTLSHEGVGGAITVTTGGANVQLRGTFTSITLILSGGGTVDFVGVTGAITISGTATTTVNLYGVSDGPPTDTSSGTTVTDKTISRANINTEVDAATGGVGLSDTALQKIHRQETTLTTWWVDKVNGSGGNGGTSEDDAFDTIAAALSAASNDEVIRIAKGDYPEQVNPFTAGLTGIWFQGAGRDAVNITHSTNSESAIVTHTGTRINNLSATATGTSSSGISNGSNTHSDILIEDVDATGTQDGMLFLGATNVTARRSRFTSPYDGFAFQGTTGFLVEDCEGISTAAHASNEGRGAFISEFNNVESQGTIRNTFLSAVRTNDGGTSADAQTAGIRIANASQVFLDGNTYQATSSDGTYVGTVSGIDVAGGQVNVRHSTFATLDEGTGTAVDYRRSGGVLAVQGQYDDSKTEGTITSWAADTLEDTSTTIPAAIAAVQADLPTAPTKNVALDDFQFFMVLSSDHVTGGTGLTVTAQRSIDGGAFGNASNAVVEIGSGVYKIDMSASDLNGDTICWRFTATTADARIITMVMQPT